MEGKLRVRVRVSEDTVQIKTLATPLIKPGVKKPRKKKATVIPAGLRKGMNVLLEGPVASVVISKDYIERLPSKPEKFIYRAPAYYQNNREKFILKQPVFQGIPSISAESQTLGGVTTGPGAYGGKPA